jgi:hypothetical protein
MSPATPATFPDSQGASPPQWSEEEGGTRKSKTYALAVRLSHLQHPRAQRAALALEHCATNDDGWRCKHALCPRCQARIAKRRRRDVERDLRAVPSSVPTAHVTLTLGVDDIVAGRHVLLDAFGALRRRLSWRALVLGGRAQVEVLPAAGGARAWNVHLHALVYLAPGKCAPVAGLRSEWRDLLGPLPGNLSWTPIPRRFANARTTFLAGRVLCDEAEAVGVARHDRRATSRARSRSAGSALGHSLRNHRSAPCGHGRWS